MGRQAGQHYGKPETWIQFIREQMEDTEFALSKLERIMKSGMKGRLPCKRHKPKSAAMGYEEYARWQIGQEKLGRKQHPCPKCGRWYYRCEY